MNEQVLNKIQTSVLSFRNFLSEGDDRARKEWKSVRRRVADGIEDAAKYADHLQTAVNSSIDITNMTGKAVVDTRGDVKALLKKCKVKSKLARVLYKEVDHVDSKYLRKVLPKVAKMIRKAKPEVGVIVCDIILRWVQVTITTANTVEKLSQLWHTFEGIQARRKEKENNTEKE